MQAFSWLIIDNRGQCQSLAGGAGWYEQASKQCSSMASAPGSALSSCSGFPSLWTTVSKTNKNPFPPEAAFGHGVCHRSKQR